MANDFRKFLLELDDFTEKVGSAATTVQTRVAVDLFKRIVDKTPVDTGRARASWNMSVNEADRSVPPEGQASYPKPHPPILQMQPGDSIVISNNLPYITALEDGHSKQAPPHAMVALSIEEVKLKMAALMQAGLKDAGL
jgi:hypothetical protein